MSLRPTNLAVIRPASYGIRGARGYLLYWESESGYQALDAWTIYASAAAARAAAAKCTKGVVREGVQ